MKVQVTVTFRFAAVSVDAVAFLHVSPAFEAMGVSENADIHCQYDIPIFTISPDT